MKVKLFSHVESKGTDKAHVFFREPAYASAFYIPRSVVKHVSYDPPDTKGFRICYVEVADWFAEKEDL